MLRAHATKQWIKFEHKYFFEKKIKIFNAKIKKLAAHSQFRGWKPIKLCSCMPVDNLLHILIMTERFFATIPSKSRVLNTSPWCTDMRKLSEIDPHNTALKSINNAIASFLILAEYSSCQTYNVQLNETLIMLMLSHMVRIDSFNSDCNF